MAFRCDCATDHFGPPLGPSRVLSHHIKAEVEGLMWVDSPGLEALGGVEALLSDALAVTMTV